MCQQAKEGAHALHVVELFEVHDLIADDEPDVAHAALVVEPRGLVAIVEVHLRMKRQALGGYLLRPIGQEVEVIEDGLQALGQLIAPAHLAGEGNDLGRQVDGKRHVFGKAGEGGTEIARGPRRISTFEQDLIVCAHTLPPGCMIGQAVRLSCVVRGG